jgi:hypothetical protein
VEEYENHVKNGGNADGFLHTAVGNILHTSGRADIIKKLVRDLGESGNMLAGDGSTNIGALLSVLSGYPRLRILTSLLHDNHVIVCRLCSFLNFENRQDPLILL